MTSDMNISDGSRAESGKKPNKRKGFFWASAMARRIIAFNLIALCVLLMGMLYIAQFRSNIETERLSALQVEAGLYASLIAERSASDDVTSVSLLSVLAPGLPQANSSEIRVYDTENTLLLTQMADEYVGSSGRNAENNNKFINIVDVISRKIETLLKGSAPQMQASNTEEIAYNLALSVIQNGQGSVKETIQSGEIVTAFGQPILQSEVAIGTIVVSTPAGLMDDLRKQERNNILRLFALAAGLSVILSLVLAKTIANPIHDLAAAMEAGSTSKLRKDNPDRVRIPDMTARDDEIGHLSSAMQNMTSALYHRIETNEQFAADVAHEIKNPLASLRSAIETLRIAPEGEKRNILLDVVEHDVRRLDRLVTDISNASRLDSDLVKEEEESFDVTRMLQRIVDFHGLEAKELGIEVFFDKPDDKIIIYGLEERLAQVFVNLISNAVSFCESGDAVRLWARRVENRVLIVVEDTGQGIPEDSLAKVFERFYSNRSAENFGNNSGLGLSISKQIVEAHGGVIWAENIQAKGADETAPPLGARFVVGLPG